MNGMKGRDLISSVDDFRQMLTKRGMYGHENSHCSWICRQRATHVLGSPNCLISQILQNLPQLALSSRAVQGFIVIGRVFPNPHASHQKFIYLLGKGLEKNKDRTGRSEDQPL